MKMPKHSDEAKQHFRGLISAAPGVVAALPPKVKKPKKQP
jgi:hypothetical protein